MGVYQSNGSTIGNLLRAIQEEKSQSPLGAPPQTEAGSPIRGLTQGSLLQPESPDSSRVVSVRPELSTSETPGVVGPRPFDSIAPVAAPGSPLPVVNPVNPVLDVAPANPVAPPEFAPSSPSRPTSTSQVSAPSLGTKINSLPSTNSSVGSVKGVSTSSSKSATPKIPVPSPTPAPQRPKQNTPQPNRVGQVIADAFKQLQGLGTKIFGSTSKVLAKK